MTMVGFWSPVPAAPTSCPPRAQMPTGRRDGGILPPQPQPVTAFWPSIDQTEQTAMQIEIVTQIEVHGNVATASLINQSRT